MVWETLLNGLQTGKISLKQAGSINIICGSWEDRFKGLLR